MPRRGGSRSTVIRQANDNLALNPSSRLGATAWLVAALLAIALIALLHDRDYATARGMESAEAGRDLATAVKETGVAGAAPIRLIGFGSLVGAGFVCVMTLCREPRIRWDALAFLIGFLILWAFASWAWSAHRGTTARELIRLSIYLGVAAALACRFDLRRLCIVFAIALAGSALTAVGYEIITGGFKPWQADYRLTGTMHSNALAIQAGVVAIIAYAFAARGNERKLLWYAICLAAIAIVVLTKTRTALATVLVGAVVIHMIGRPSREWLIYATSAMSLVAAGLIAATVFHLPIERPIQKLVSLGRSGDDDTLTGRVPLWGFILHETRAQRLQGAGYGAFWLRERTERANDALRWFPRQSHNSYVEILANLGLMGLVLAVSIGLVALARAMLLAAHVGGPGTYVMAGLLAAAFVNGFTETAFVMPRDIGLITAALVFSMVLQPSRQNACMVEKATRNGAMKSAAPFVPRRTSLRLSPGQQGD